MDHLYFCVEKERKLVKIFLFFRWLCWGGCSQPIKLKDALKCNILWRKCGMKLSFWVLKVSYNLIIPFLVNMVWHAQIGNQISEFWEGQHLKKDFVDYLGFFACKKNMNKAIKYFPILDSCVEVNILSHSSCRIP